MIRVLCVDDHAFLAEGLRSKIELEMDLEFAGWLPDASNLWREAKDARQLKIARRRIAPQEISLSFQ